MFELCEWGIPFVYCRVLSYPQKLYFLANLVNTDDTSPEIKSFSLAQFSLLVQNIIHMIVDSSISSNMQEVR